MTPILSIALFLLASLAWGILIAGLLLYLHRPRVTAPTLHHRRRNRDRLPDVHSVPPMPMYKVPREHCINCGLSVDPQCACERGRKLRDTGIEALDAERQDEDRVRYQFMGTTGFEE
ncbi:hypothetical protein [Paraburkholderia sediminicola]|uniref:hypothetical protein n=1 Tax=Paraburkholderia sediminicola TaxID=458836 RepID=UPI0038B8A13E